MFRLACCALSVLVLGVTAFPVEVPQDAAVIGRPLKVGEVYMVQVFQPIRYGNDDELNNYIPSGDYLRKPPPSVVLGFVPPLPQQKPEEDYFPMKDEVQPQNQLKYLWMRRKIKFTFDFLHESQKLQFLKI